MVDTLLGVLTGIAILIVACFAAYLIGRMLGAGIGKSLTTLKNKKEDK